MRVLLSLSGLLLCFAFSGASAGAVEKGRILQSQTMTSGLLGSALKYSVYLPPGYELGGQAFPVTFLLHGYGGDETSWLNDGQVSETLDEAIASQALPPMIVVMPASGWTWYLNDYRKRQPYEDMFFREFVPWIERSFRVQSGREAHAIAGLSMGGYGALIYCFRHPEYFASCAGLSSAILADDDALERIRTNYHSFGDIYGPADSGRLPAYWFANSVSALVRNLPWKQFSATRFYLDCGDRDPFHATNAALVATMKSRGINVAGVVRPGSHDWDYWRSGILGALQFISAGFRAEAPSASSRPSF